MAALKFWNGTSWVKVDARPVPTGYIPTSGGTITGDLVVNTGYPWDSQIATNGTIQAGPVKSTVFDGNIRLTGSKTVNMGGAVGTGAIPPAAADGKSAATKNYIDGRFAVRSTHQAATLLSGWTPYQPPYGEPGYRKDGDGRYVALEGLLKATTPITPGTASPKIFQLPTGYRPVRQVWMATIGSGNALYTLTVYPDGYVQVLTGGAIPVNEWLCLDGRMFPLT